MGGAALLPASRSFPFLLFLFFSVVAPLLTAWVVHLDTQSGTFGGLTAGRPLDIAKVVLLIAMVALAANAAVSPSVLLTMLGIVTVGVVVALFHNWSKHPVALDVFLVASLGAVVFIYSPFDPAEAIPVGLLRYAVTTPNFALWLVVGVVWTAFGIWLRRREAWAFGSGKVRREILACVLVVAIILALYDDSHFVDFSHYMPLVGPALHALRGGIPFVDVHSQYGFGTWIVLVPAFELFQPTFGTAAVVIRAVNVAYFLVVLALLCAISRRRLSALWFFVPALLVALTTHGTGPIESWNLNSLPMTLGLRYLLPASMAAVLVVSTTYPRAWWTSLPILALASIANIEIFAFTLAPWGFCLLFDAVRTRAMTVTVKKVAYGLAAVLAVHGILVLAIFATSGHLVQYGLYFDLVAQFGPSTDSLWSVPFTPFYALWLPIALSYFSVMAAATYRALRGDPGDSYVERLLPVAALGLGPLAYFFGRPQEATLNLSCVAFAVVAIVVAEVLFVKPRRYGPIGPALFATIVLFFAFTIADGFEHFMRPFDPRRGNASVLRQCLSHDGCRIDVVASNIGLALDTQPLDSRTKVGHLVGEDRGRIEEAIDLLNKWTGESAHVGMLVDTFPSRMADAGPAIGLAAFMATGQWYAWSISSPLNDGLSPAITERILARVGETLDGLPILISNEKVDWVALNSAILQKLTHRCSLSLRERGRYHSLYTTSGCPKAS